MIINRKVAEEAWGLLRSSYTGEEDVSMAFVDITPATVNAVYRRAAVATHPDKEGGDAEKFARVDRAKHILLKWLERQTAPTLSAITDGLCKNCSGTGFIKVTHGFKTTRRTCPACRGTGDMNYEHEKGGE